MNIPPKRHGHYGTMAPTSLEAWTWAVRPPVRRARGRRRPPKIWRRPWPSSTLDDPWWSAGRVEDVSWASWGAMTPWQPWFMMIYLDVKTFFIWSFMFYVDLCDFECGFSRIFATKKSKQEDVPGKQGIVWFNCHAVECDTWSAQANHLWVCLRISPRPSLLGTIVYESWELLECVGPGVYSTD